MEWIPGEVQKLEIMFFAFDSWISQAIQILQRFSSGEPIWLPNCAELGQDGNVPKKVSEWYIFTKQLDI